MTTELRRARFRQLMLFLLICASLLGETWRLVEWQSQDHLALAALAQQQQLQPIIVPAGRGAVTDANGSLLALSVTENALDADPQAIQQANSDHPGALDDTVQQLSSILNLPATLLRPQLLLSQHGQPLPFTFLVDAQGQKIHATATQSGHIQDLLKQGQLDGIGLLPESVRHYIDGSLAAQLLGFVQQDTAIGQYG